MFPALPIVSCLPPPMNARASGLLALIASACFGDEPLTDDERPGGLIEAVQSGSLPAVRRMLAMGVPAGAVEGDGDTPLCAALRLGMGDIAVELLDHGADPTACGRDGQSPVALASLRRHPKALKMLLNAGAKPNVIIATPVSPAVLDLVNDESLRNRLKRERKITPLMICAGRGDVEAVAQLLAAGARRDAIPR